MFPSPAFAGEALVFEGVDGDGSTIALEVRRVADGTVVCQAAATAAAP